MEELGEVTESTDVSPETEAETIRALRFPVTLYGCGGWTGKTADRKTWSRVKYSAAGSARRPWRQDAN